MPSSVEARFEKKIIPLHLANERYSFISFHRKFPTVSLIKTPTFQKQTFIDKLKKNSPEGSFLNQETFDNVISVLLNFFYSTNLLCVDFFIFYFF